ncbi:MAG TPA: stage V sporulation protein B [Bacilli bacterium]
MGKQSFIQGTLILLAAGIINRLLGFVPRIILPRLIGSEGVGLYQMGYPLMIVILTVIAGGIPLAVAKLVAEAESRGNETEIRAVLRTALLLSVGAGAIFTILCLLGAGWIAATLFTDERVVYTFLAMCPIILFVGVSSVLRGYFQGRQNMIPTAASSIAETLVRIVAVLMIAYVLLPYGIQYAAAGAMAGVTLGELCGMLVIYAQYRKYKRALAQPQIANFRNSRGNILPRLLSLSIPVTGSKLVGSGSYFLESIWIVQALAAAGIATATATSQYGALQGMVIPILLLPNALTYSLSVSLVPSLSEAAARNDRATINRRLQQSIRLALVSGAPFAVVMFVLANPLCRALYNDAQVGDMLKMMAPIALFIYFQGPLQAALQALDRPGAALFNTFIGACVKLTLISLLASNPAFGIIGAIIAINANIVLVTLLHWRSIAKLLKISLNIAEFAKVGFVMFAMGVVCGAVMHAVWTENEHARLFASVGCGMFAYLWLIARCKLIGKEDVRRIPLIGKWAVKFTR